MVTLSWMSNSIKLNQRAGSLLIEVIQEILLPSPKDTLLKDVESTSNVNPRTRCCSVPTTQVDEQGSGATAIMDSLASKMVHTRGACYYGQILRET